MQIEGVVLSFNNNLAKSSFNILLHTKTIWNVAAAIAENWSCRNFTTAKKLDHINKTPGIEVRVFLLMERLFWKRCLPKCKKTTSCPYEPSKQVLFLLFAVCFLSKGRLSNWGKYVKDRAPALNSQTKRLNTKK